MVDMTRDEQGTAWRPMTASEYPWPVPPDHTSPPQWTERGFVLDGMPIPVIAYTQSESGWSDELTTFHEETAGTDHPIDRASRSFALSGLDQLKRDDPVILEIGCSSGYLLRLIRDRYPRATVIGADYVLGPLEELAPTLPDVPIIQFDLTQCPLPSQSVDAVIMLNVLEHIKDDQAALQQVYRILRPGGLLILEVPAGPRLYDVYDELLMHFRRYTMRRVKRLFGRVGFESVSATHLGAIVFPAFALVKLRNRRFLSREQAYKQQVVAGNIRSTGSSFLLKAAFGLETWLGRRITWPFGIRCVLLGWKPDQPNQ